MDRVNLAFIEYQYSILSHYPALTNCLQCSFGVRKSIWTVKNRVMRCCRGYLIYLEQGANDLHMVQLMLLSPHHLLL